MKSKWIENERDPYGSVRVERPRGVTRSATAQQWLSGGLMVAIYALLANNLGITLAATDWMWVATVASGPKASPATNTKRIG